MRSRRKFQAEHLNEGGMKEKNKTTHAVWSKREKPRGLE